MEPLNIESVIAARASCMQAIGKLPIIPLEGNKDCRAAVLVPLVQSADGPGLLFTVRTKHLSSYAGYVVFPGGKFDHTDLSLQDTALRETEEELGIPRSVIDIWGQFPRTLPVKNLKMAVMPVIGFIRDFESLTLKPNADEVEEVFTVPLRQLCDPKYFGFQEFQNGYPTIVPAYTVGSHKISGLTGIITHLFLSCLLPENIYPMQFQHGGTPIYKSQL